eukprot:SAG22_NODE_15619_length_344_cov_1.661224_1_plen_38_part_10
MDIVQIKQLRKAIRQTNFDKKLFDTNRGIHMDSVKLIC